jgi:two-component system KDP operon response regulator KdpE
LGFMNHGAAFDTPWSSAAAPRPSAGYARNRGTVVVAGSIAQKRLEVRTTLESEGYDVCETSSPDRTLQEVSSGEYDLLILDSAIDGVGPYELCRAVRSRSDLGIIVLRRDEHELAGSDVLNAGADDYLPSTFVVGELLARVRAILRRVPRPRPEERTVFLPDRTIDLKSRKVTGPHGRVRHLTPKEFLVLKYLLAHADQPRTHQNLAHAVWQRNAEGEVEYVRVVIGQLRRKLEPDPEHPRYLLTERAIGYRLRLPQVFPAARTDIPATAPSE